MSSRTAGALPAGAAAAPRARVGPNAVVQTRAALDAQLGPEVTRSVFAAAGLARHLAAPPESMIEETEAARLFAAVYGALAPAQADAVMRDAGRRTARYLLRHRIPPLAQGLLRALPAPLAGRLLLAAIARHAWTFAGSGSFTAQGGARGSLEIADNPLSAPGCLWHVAVFETLLRSLVHPATAVRHDHHGAGGGVLCRFEFGVAAQPGRNGPPRRR